MLIEGLALFAFILVVIFLVMSYFSTSKKSHYKNGTTIDIEKHISGLLDSSNKQAFLIIKILGTNRFTQLIKKNNGLQLDFPLVTDEQKNSKNEIKKIAHEMKLKLTSNIRNKGTEFLDIYLEGGSGQIANTIEQIMTQLFEIDNNTHLEFQTNGYYLQIS